MTKYSINPELAVPEKQEPKKKTVFRSYVDRDGYSHAFNRPDDYKNVQLLWRDNRYGDVFAVWDDNPNKRRLYFGEAGDEFGPLPPKP